MKRPFQHVMEDESEKLLKNFLPSSWIIRPILKDYGVDYEIELVDRQAVTGNRIWVQLKAIKKARIASQRFFPQQGFAEFLSQRDQEGQLVLDISYVAFPIATKALRYALKCAFPLLLFLADLGKGEIYWLPLRDDILGTLGKRDPEWHQKRSVTLRIPPWNTLSSECQKDFPVVRWYALEPARMYAFATLHHYYHEFGYNGRLSGYEIGEGFMDPAEEEELQKSLLLAKRYISAALDLDVLFGDQGIDFLKQLTRGQLEAGLKSADMVLQALECKGYSFIGLSLSIAQVAHAMDLFSTVINSYQGFRDKYLLTEGTAVWRAAEHIHGQDDGPIFPAAIESHVKKGKA